MWTDENAKSHSDSSHVTYKFTTNVLHFKKEHSFFSQIQRFFQNISRAYNQQCISIDQYSSSYIQQTSKLCDCDSSPPSY